MGVKGITADPTEPDDDGRIDRDGHDTGDEDSPVMGFIEVPPGATVNIIMPPDEPERPKPKLPPGWTSMDDYQREAAAWLTFCTVGNLVAELARRCRSLVIGMNGLSASMAHDNPDGTFMAMFGPALELRELAHQTAYNVHKRTEGKSGITVGDGD